MESQEPGRRGGDGLPARALLSAFSRALACVDGDVGRDPRSPAASRACPAARVSSRRWHAACISMESFIPDTTDAAPNCWVAARYRIRVTRAPISLPGRTVIFDFGEVISLTPSDADRAAIARLADVDNRDAERFWRAYSAHRDGLDQGTAGAIAYWQAISDDLGAAWDEARMHELWAADFRSWLSINPAVIEVLSDLRGRRHPTGAALQRRPGLRQLLPARPAGRLLRGVLRQR